MKTCTYQGGGTCCCLYPAQFSGRYYDHCAAHNAGASAGWPVKVPLAVLPPSVLAPQPKWGKRPPLVSLRLLPLSATRPLCENGYEVATSQYVLNSRARDVRKPPRALRLRGWQVRPCQVGDGYLDVCTKWVLA